VSVAVYDYVSRFGIIFSQAGVKAGGGRGRLERRRESRDERERERERTRMKRKLRERREETGRSRRPSGNDKLPRINPRIRIPSPFVRQPFVQGMSGARIAARSDERRKKERKKEKEKEREERERERERRRKK